LDHINLSLQQNHVGPCLGRPSDPPGNLSGVVFGQQRFKDVYSPGIQWNTKSYKRLSNPNLTQEFQVHFEAIHEHSSVLEKESTFEWGHSVFGRIRMYKSIGIPNFYYILMNFLGYRVLFGVYKIWLYTQEEEEELWGPWPDTNKLFLGSPCY
jgi:hypothetical protein